jgi:glutathione-regulated potassium-efflux system protein KefB
MGSMASSYLIDTIILLCAAVVVVPISHAIRLGAVPGFVIAGVVIGPYCFGLIENTGDISHLAEIGVVFLLFIVGIQLKPIRLWQMRRYVFGLGVLQVLVAGALLSAVTYYVFGLSSQASILVGPALALSSTAFVLQLLSDQKLLTSVYGRSSISVLLFQDLAVVPLMALVPLLAAPEFGIGSDIGYALGKSVLILGGVVLTGRYLLNPLLQRIALTVLPEVFTASAILLVLGIALITESSGLSMAMGAFLAGLLLSDSTYKHQIMAEIQPFRGLLLGLFFMSMGMSLNLMVIWDSPGMTIAAVLGLLLLKAVVLLPLALAFGIGRLNSLAVALVLAESGEFALVLFALAFQVELLSNLQFQQLLAVVVISMLTTPLLAYFAQRLVRKGGSRIVAEELPTTAPIVVAGFGRVGQRIGEILALAEKPYVALDSDAGLVEKARADGLPVYFGDVRKPELLKSAGAANAQVIIVTLNDIEATEALVSALRKTYPEKILYVRGHSLVQCLELRRLGAAGAVSENVEASLELARMALTTCGFNENRREAILNDFRDRYRAQIDDVLVEESP